MHKGWRCAGGKAIKTIPNPILRIAMGGVIDKDSVIRKIAKDSGIEAAEIEERVGKKKAKFAGLLTDSGAAFMVAKELGVGLEVEGGLQESLRISQLEEGMQNIDLVVRVMHAFTPKKFEKNGRRGVLCNLLVADSTGETRLTLWHKDVQKFIDAGIERGAVLALRGCRVTAYSGKKQLDLGFGGSFSIGGGGAAELPEPDARLLKLNELGAGMNNIDAYARVARVYGQKAFQKGEKEGVVMNFEIADETAALRAAAWNELAEVAATLAQGELIKIEGAYVKEGLRGAEVNLGWQARVVKNPNHKMKELGELAGTAIERKMIGELVADRNAEISAKVVEVLPGNLHYRVCPNCGRKAESVSGGWVCSGCGEVEEPGINPVIGFEVSDSSARIRAVAFGREAEFLMGISKDGLKKRLEKESPEAIIDELNPKLAGTEFLLQGRARKNTFSGELEFILSSLPQPAPETRPKSV